MKHVILELICLQQTDVSDSPVPPFCRWGPGVEGFHCLGVAGVHCSHLGYSEAEHEMALSGDSGEVADDDFIGFGGEMIPESDPARAIQHWRSICRQQLNTAYEVYTKWLKDNGEVETTLD